MRGEPGTKAAASDDVHAKSQEQAQQDREGDEQRPGEPAPVSLSHRRLPYRPSV
jgi:hypothetical protein